MKTPSSNTNSLTLTKPNTNSNPMKSTKSSRSLKPAHVLVGSILALALGATPAMAADATWNGAGDGVNWSDLTNWTGNPSLASTTFKLNAATSTVDLNTMTAWTSTGRAGDMYNNSVLNIPAGGRLGNDFDGAHWRMHTGSVMNITGGAFGMDLRPYGDGHGGTINISGATSTYRAARITFVKSATVNITGTPTQVKVSDFFSWMNNSLPTLGFTLDAGGVTPFQFDTHGQDSNPDGNIPGSVALNVGGIATYAAGAMPMGLVIPLVRDTNSNLAFPNAFTLGKLVDGGAGWVSRVNNGVDLTVLEPSLASVWQGGTSDWNTATWTVGGTPNQAAGTKLMTVDVAASVVTVTANASSAVVAIGQTNASTVTVNAATTLTALNGVVVGANGTLNVDGNLTATAAVLTSAGTTTFGATSGGTIGAVEVTAGTTTLAGSATFGTVYLSGTGTLAFSSPAATGTLSVRSGTITGTATANTKFIFPLTASLAVANDLAGTGGLEKGIVDKTIAATTLTLSGNNTYTGVTTVSSGILSVSNLQDAGVASHLGAYATPGAAGIVLGTTVPNHPIATLRYTGASMGAAINRGITLVGSSTVDVKATGSGDMRLGSLALASAAAMDLNVTGNGVAASRLYIDSVTVPTSTVSRQGPVFKPNTASLTIGSITGNGNFQMQGAAGASDNIITGPINLGAGNTTADQEQIFGPIAANTWTIMSENTFPGRWYAAAGVVKIKSPGNLGSPNVSTAFGNGNWPGTAQGTTKFYNGNTVVQLLNDLSTSYENGSGQRASVRTGGGNATFNVGPQGTATDQTHKLGNLWIHDNNMNVNVNSINASGAVTANGYGLTFDEVRIRDGQTGTFVANTTLGLAGITKSSGSGTSHLRFNGTGTTTVTGTAPVHPGGTLNITKLGGGTLIFNGLNTYNGTTAVTVGTLVAANGDALGTTGADTTVSSGATLDVRAALVAEPISVTGTGVGGLGALITADTFTGTVTGPLTLTGNTSIGGAGSTGTLNIDGILAAGANTLTTLGTGVTNFGVPSTLTSLTNLLVTDGTTNVNSALGTAGNTTVNVSDLGNGTKLRFGSVSQTLTSLTIGAGATVVFTSGLASGSLTGDDGGGKAAGFGGGATVPEPGTLGLLLVGALGLLKRRRRQA